MYMYMNSIRREGFKADINSQIAQAADIYLPEAVHIYMYWQP